MRFVTTMTLVMVSWLCWAQPAAAARLALVIGNDAYENVPPLEKARNDAHAMATALAGLGYDVVAAEDVGRRAMERALAELEGRLEGGDTVVFFFAGHGFAVDGTNYLLPVDVPAPGAGEEHLVREAGFAAAGLAERLEGKGVATTVMILDACRDNPFGSMGTRGIAPTRGLVRMEPARGSFVLFSAGTGQAALDGLGSDDPSPNSVFTRVLLSQIARPGRSLLQVAKATQVAVRDLAAKIGYDQTPAYYDEVVGELFLAPDGPAAAGTVSGLKEGAGSVLPPLPQVQMAALPPQVQPTANFMRSNSGWTVAVSLPEAAIQFGYRVGEGGDFKDAGLTPNLDPRTGRPLPRLFFELPPDQPPTTLYVTWRDRRGEQADIFPIAFDPAAALFAGQRSILDSTWTSWLAFGDFKGLSIYFTHLISYRCAIAEVRYGLDAETPAQVWALPDCDPANPNGVPPGAPIYRAIPTGTSYVTVQLAYRDGTRSEIRRFNVR